MADLKEKWREKTVKISLKMREKRGIRRNGAGVA
jgi:hypothetical protein